MTTSGQAPWLPTIAEVIDEAFEYAGIDPASATSRHLASATRSMNQVYLWLENKHEALFRDDVETVEIGPNQPTFFAPADTLNIKRGTIRAAGDPNSHDQNVVVFAKQTWFDMPDKSMRGRPSIMALNYSTPVSRDGMTTDVDSLYDFVPEGSGYGEGGYSMMEYGDEGNLGGSRYDASGPQVILWPVPDRSYILSYIRVRQSQRAVSLGQDVDARRIWTLAIIYKLSSLLALKFNEKKFATLDSMAEKSLEETNGNNRQTNDVKLSMHSFSPIRRGRRF